MTKKDLKQFGTGFFYWWYNQEGTNTDQGFDSYWNHLRSKIFDCLAEMENGMFKRKFAIAEETKIPESLLTHILKEMKQDGVVFISVTFSEWSGLASGSGYGLVQNNKNHKNASSN